MAASELTDNGRLLLDKASRAWGGETDLVFEIYSETFVNHSAWRSHDPGRQGVCDLIKACRAAFPDLVATTDDAFQLGSKLSMRATFVGTHLGDYGSIAATGRKATWNAIGVFWIKDGRFQEEWSTATEAVLLSQLGIELLTPAVPRVPGVRDGAVEAVSLRGSPIRGVKLSAKSPPALAVFYREVLGWTTNWEELLVGPKGDPRHLGKYGVVNTGYANDVFVSIQPSRYGEFWGGEESLDTHVAVAVDDIDATLRLVVEQGGKIVCPPVSPNVRAGTQSVIQDPEGNTFILWQPSAEWQTDAWANRLGYRPVRTKDK